MYDKLTAMDKYLYDMEIKICDECKSFEDCQQPLKGQRPIITEDKYYKSVRLGHEDCNKRYGVVLGKYKNKVLNADKLNKNTNRNKIIKKMIEKKNGYLYGEAGIGKTTIMLNLAKYYYEQGYTVMYDLEVNITTDMKDFGDSESTFKKMEKYQMVDILFIDDMFREKMTLYKIMDIINPIIQYRIDNGLPTFINSNYSLTDIREQITELVDEISGKTIADRLITLGVYKLEDKNYRLEK